MKLFFNINFGLLFCVFLSFSCTNLDEVDTEQRQIDQFVQTLRNSKDSILKHAKYIQQDGIQYIRLKAGDTLNQLKIGDKVEFFYYGRLLTDTIPFDTNIKAVALHFKMDSTFLNFKSKQVIIGSGDLLEGIQRGLKMSHRGEQALIIFNSNLGLGKSPSGIVPGASPLLFEITVK